MNSGLERGDFFGGVIAPLRALAEAERLWRPAQQLRGVALMSQGADAGRVFVLERGLVKLVYATPDGGERVKSFIVDQGLFGPALDDAEERYSATTLEPSVTVALPSSWLVARMAENALLRDAAARFEVWVRKRKQAREMALLCRTPEERYLDLLRDEPGLVSRLSQGDIARFIGITPIAFSRIKRRVAR